MQAARRLGAQKVILFGSRARGDHRERSDIDLAIYGMPKENESEFRDAIDQLPTLLDFDLVFITDQTSPALIQNIKEDGIIIMSKAQERAINLTTAVKRLQEAIKEYESFHYDSMRDGAIQRFEFCAELAWKALRDYLLEQGYTNINSPKSVLKQAYADGFLSDESDWIQLIQARNLTSHLYDESTASEIYRNIAEVYSNMLEKLAQKLVEKSNE